MKALITGGLGQVGSHVAELLLARGDEVAVIDNLATGRREHLPEQDRLQLIIDTIADRGVVDGLVSAFKPDVIVHAAASYKDPDDWYEDAMTNTVGAVNLIDAARKHGVGRIIYFQTALTYGIKPSQQPIRLDHPKDPSASSYAITKTTTEDFLALSGVDYVSFRLANVVGPRNVAGPLPIFYQRLRDGKRCFITESRRDFVFVGDLAPIVVKACDGTGHGAYHFSSGTDVAISELFEATAKALGLSEYPEPEVRALGPDDVFSILLDPSHTFEDFGKIDFTPLQDTVTAAIRYYQEHGTLGEYTHLRLDLKKE